MLQSIRDKAQGWLAWTIVTLISIPFALWGIQEYLGAGGDPGAASVNGVEITQRELDNAVQRQRSALREQLGAAYDPERFPDSMLRQQVLNRMIQDLVVNQTADELGLRAGDDMVRSQILQVPSFQRAGRFDQQAYESALRTQGYSPAGFEETLRSDLGSMLLENGVSGSALVTDREVDEYVKLRDQTRDMSVVTVKADAFLGGEAPTQEAIKEYYDKNLQGFMRPERVKIEYLELDQDKLAAGIAVSEEDVMAYYDERKSEYTAPEERRIRHVLLTVDGEGEDVDAAMKAEAESLVQQLRDGADFAAIASEHSKDPGSAANGGDLGMVGRGVMVAPFENAAFSLAEGDISDPVKTEFGYHIIQVTEISPERVQTLEEARHRVSQAFKQGEAENIFYDYADQLANLTYENPDSLLSAAEALNLEVQESDWVTRGGGQGVLANPKVTAAAFSEDVLEGGNNSDPIELTPTQILVVRTVEHEESAPKPLDEVGDEIVSAIDKQQAAEAAAVRAKEVSALVASGSTLESAGQAHGLEMASHSSLTRQSRELPPLLVREAFRAPAGADAHTAKLSGGDVAVYVVDKVVDADVSGLDEEGRKAVKDQIASQRAQREFGLFVAQRREGFDIDIKPGVTDAAR